MSEFRTPFSGTVGVDKVPTSGSAGSSSEPNLPEGTPGRSGGLLPEKLRDSHVTPKSPEWKNPGEAFKYGTSD